MSVVTTMLHWSFRFRPSSMRRQKKHFARFDEACGNSLTSMRKKAVPRNTKRRKRALWINSKKLLRTKSAKLKETFQEEGNLFSFFALSCIIKDKAKLRTQFSVTQFADIVKLSYRTRQEITIYEMEPFYH